MPCISGIWFEGWGLEGIQGAAVPKQPLISVIVCCHNSEMRLEPALRSLAAQIIPSDLRWELIVIDNASQDHTADVAGRVLSDCGLEFWQILKEDKVGLSNARQAGIRASKGEVFCFVDDDNRVPPQWLNRVWNVMRSDSTIGACGGPTKPKFEIKPPEWFDRFATSYAAGSRYWNTIHMPTGEGLDYLW